MLKKIKELWNNRKWTLYLYYNGVLIKRVKINDIEDIKVMSINILGHKEWFNKSRIKAVIRPVRLLLTEENKKRTHWGVIFEKGVEYNGR